MTRFGTILASHWSFLELPNSVWQTIAPSLANISCHRDNFRCCKWLKIEQLMSPSGRTGGLGGGAGWGKFKIKHACALSNPPPYVLIYFSLSNSSITQPNLTSLSHTPIHSHNSSTHDINTGTLKKQPYYESSTSSTLARGN